PFLHNQVAEFYILGRIGLFSQCVGQSSRLDYLSGNQNFAQPEREIRFCLQYLKFGQQRFERVLLEPSLSNVLQHLANLIARREQPIDNAWTEGHFSATQSVEDIFCTMTYAHHRFEA